jgi:CheY-like chemotaxis protein
MAKVILLVEDDASIRDALSQILRLEGYDVLTGGDGKEALAALKRNRPDIILLDLMMPVMDGYEFARQIHSSSAWSEIPVVAVTAQRMGRVNGNGFRAVIEKPFDLESLLAVIKKLT